MFFTNARKKFQGIYYFLIDCCSKIIKNNNDYCCELMPDNKSGEKV